MPTDKSNPEINIMKKFLLTAAILCSLTALGQSKRNQPATVIITAGQSNTDGRVLNNALPDYIRQNKYKYCQWCYGSAGQQITGEFETFWPRMVHQARPGRWAYDAVTYYWLEQALQKDFYLIKCSLRGTAIDTGCSSTSGKYWSADPKWLAANHSTATGGKSLLLSFTENISACIDNKLDKLPEGYEIKAFLWHQGESDRHKGENYYKMLEQPREMGEMTLKDFVPMSLRCQMRSNRKSGKCKEKQNIAGERFANHYPRRCKI